MRSAVLLQRGVEAAIEAEAAAQGVGVRDKTDVVLDHLCWHRPTLDRELVAEVDVFAPGDELLGHAFDPVERDVPQLVVDEAGNEHRRRGGRGRRPGDLGQGDAVDPLGVIRGERVSDREAGVVPDHGEAVVPEAAHHRDEVLGEGARVVSDGRLVGQPDAALVDRDHGEVTGQ